MSPLLPGDSAPWFHAPAIGGNPRYAFDTVAGRPSVVLFPGPVTRPEAQAALAVVAKHRALFDDARACFFGVAVDPADWESGRVAPAMPGIRWFADADRAVSKLYGATDDAGTRYAPHWLLLDRRLRVVARASLDGGEAILRGLAQLIEDDAASTAEHAPVLVVPRVLEPDLCRRLIALYDRRGGHESGFMREENGVTVERTDHAHKRRSDCHVDDPQLQAELRARLTRFLVPQIARAFQFQATRIERWLVACYDGDNGGGHFRAHRDNTTKGTAHRKFAVTINLNAGDYEGGDLSFPEFGPRTYRAPTGGAVVFSCSLLHEAQPVRRGRRYAFLPFLYDDAGARVREANMAFVDQSISGYRSGLPAA